MPILFLGEGHDEEPRLVCINKHSEQLTMVKLAGGGGLMLLPACTRVIGCEIFTCTVCEYVELYLKRGEHP